MLSALVNNLLAPHSNLDFPSYMCTLMISTISNQNYPRIQTLPIDEFIVNPKLPGSEISKLKAALRLNIYIILLRLLLLRCIVAQWASKRKLTIGLTDNRPAKQSTQYGV